MNPKYIQCDSCHELNYFETIKEMQECDCDQNLTGKLIQVCDKCREKLSD